jgi:hypothetical protein
MSALVPGAVLPIYPLRYALYQTIGRYDEVAGEFRKLRKGHEHLREECHGS